MESGVARFSFVLVEGTNRPGVWMHAGGQTYNVSTVTPEDWKLWGAAVVQEWWSLSSFPVLAYIEQDEIQPSLLRHESHKLTDNVHYSHGSPILHYGDSERGLFVTEPLTALIGNEVFVGNAHKIEARAAYRHNLEDQRTAAFDTYQRSWDSSERFGKIFLQEVRAGVHKDLLDLNLNVLRKWLPTFKLGTPRVDDVRAKLEMEKRLRMEEGVTGSLRPLVFTLEAIQDLPDKDGVDFPGLWQMSAANAEDHDVRSYVRDLLLWDSALSLIAGAVRCHVGFKSGLLLATKEPSRTIYFPERRFSKKNSGNVTSVYIQANTQRLCGPVQAVVSRIISLATHELAHAATLSTTRHPEIHTLRWEGYLTLAAECIPAITDLVQSTVGERQYRPTVERTMNIEQFVMEEIRSRPQSLISFIVNRWAEFRNITENGAYEEISSEITRLAKLGRLATHGEDVVYSLLGT